MVFFPIKKKNGFTLFKLYFNDFLLNKKIHSQVSFTKSEWDSLLCEKSKHIFKFDQKLLDGKDYILCFDWKP